VIDGFAISPIAILSIPRVLFLSDADTFFILALQVIPPTLMVSNKPIWFNIPSSFFLKIEKLIPLLIKKFSFFPQSIIKVLCFFNLLFKFNSISISVILKLKLKEGKIRVMSIIKNTFFKVIYLIIIFFLKELRINIFHSLQILYR